MAEESILLEVGVDENQVNRSEKAIVELRTEIDRLKESNKDLADQGKKNTVEYVKNETAIKALNTSVRENQRILIANEKIQKSNTGSIADLRANVSRLKQEYVNLSQAERENEKVGGALQKELLAQTNQLKELEGGIGVTSRSVGDYTNSIIEAIDQTGLYTKAQQALALAKKAVTGATGAAGTATQGFSKILLASGIGAFIVVLGSLVTYLTKSQDGMDKLGQATAAVSAFFDVLLDSLITLGKQVFDVVAPAFLGLSNILFGIATLDFEQAKKGVRDLGEAVDAVSDVEGINILQVGRDAIDAGKDAAVLEKELQKLVRAEKQLELATAQNRAEVERLKKASDDTNKSTAERAEAARRAAELEIAQEQKRIELQQERIRILKAQNELSSSTDADRNRVIDAEIRLSEIQEQSATRQTELQNKLNALNKEAAAKQEAEAKEAAAKQEKADAEAVKKAAETQKAINEEFQKGLKKRSEETKQAIQDSINELGQQFADGLIDLDTYQEQLEQVEALTLETRRAALQDQLELTQQNSEIDAETRLQIEQDLQAKLRSLENETVSAGVAARQKEIESAKKAAEEKKKLAEETAQFQIQAENAVLSAAKTVFGEQSAAGKVAASFQALLDTYRAANLALATIPPPFGQIIAAATTVQGLANVAKINSAAPPKFAEGGGIEIGGPSHAGGGSDVTVGGHTVANVEGGEGLFVMKKNAFQSLKALSAYNQSFGGRSWLKGTHAHLADGGAISRGSVPAIDRRALQDTQQGFQDAVRKINVVARITDINRVNNEVNQVKVLSDLS